MKNELLTPEMIRSLIVPRERSSYKGDFGHVLVLAGSRGMSGAAILCSNAVLRSGAGLVTLGTPETELLAVTSRLRPEIMTLPLPGGQHHSLDRSSLPLIIDYIEQRRISALVIGPGLGANGDAYALVREMLSMTGLPVVLDADGLSALSGDGCRNDCGIAALKDAKARIIVTPHPGEFSRLSGLSIEKVQEDRAGSAVKFARENGVICVLKGYNTIVTDGDAVFTNTTGNPGMATGGSGDVLAGMIGALLAQVKEPCLVNAAVAGTFLHGLAGDIAAGAKTEIGLIAGDIIETISDAIKTIGIGNYN
jgi:NAD(P)H-hydrate epimerase